MKPRDRTGSILVIVAAGALVVSACTSTPAATSGTTAAASSAEASPSAVAEDKTLTLATDSSDRVRDVVAAFEAANPGVTVDIIDGGSGYQDFLRTRLAAGTAPDIIRTFPGLANPVAVQSLDDAGFVVDLSDRSWVSSLNPSQKLLFGSADGKKILSVPMSAAAIGVDYSDQALAAIGATPPKTWKEVLDLCALAKSKGKVAYAIFQKGGSVLTSYAMTATLVYGPDPAFTQKQIAGTATFSNSGWKTNFERQLDMLHAGCFNEGPNGTDYTAAVQLVANGDAMGVVAFTDTASIAALAPEGTTFTMTPTPVTDDANGQYLAVADSYGWAINSATKNPELARQFIDFLAGADAQNLFAKSSGGAPSIPNDTFKATSKTQQTLVDYIASGKTGSWPDQGWPNAKIPGVLLEVVQDLFEGSETPDGATAKMDAAFAGK